MFTMSKNFQYIPREAYEKDLKEQLAIEGIAVIAGGSKTGKSELVNAYYYAHEREYGQRAIWLHADSENQLLLDCNQALEEKLATKGIGKETQGVNQRNVILKQLRHQLETSNENWLIVIDDLALKDFYTDLPAPKSDGNVKHHIVIITSDVRFLSNRLPTPITIEPFNLEEIHRLFAKRLKLTKLSDEQGPEVSLLTVQLNHYLPALVLASQIYTKANKRQELLKINAAQSMDNESIMRELALLQLNDNPQLKHALTVLSLFTFSIPVVWLKNWGVTAQTIEELAQFGIDIKLVDDNSLVKLGEPLQAALLAEGMHTEVAFDEFNKPYQDALNLLNAEFAWNRVYYSKSLFDRVKESQYAQYAQALLAHFDTWDALVKEKANNAYPQATLMASATLANSLARYYFKLELFNLAEDYYEQAKAIFDRLLSGQELTDLKTKNSREPVFKNLLASLGYMNCLLYAQDILHNIGATTVKLSWQDKVEKEQALTNASELLDLSKAWQSFLISKLEESHIPAVAIRLGLDTEQAWSRDAIVKQLNHFSNFTLRILATAYQKQGKFQLASHVYQDLLNDEDYMDRIETRPLAYRDLASALRRTGNYPQALEQINEGFLDFEKAEFPMQHKPGEKIQLLYERVKIHLKMNDNAAAKQDLKEILTLNPSAIYKAKASYLLAKLASNEGHKFEARSLINDALQSIKDYNPIKYNIYQNFQRELNLAPIDEKHLAYFAKVFMQQFLLSIKKKFRELRYDINAERFKLAMGILRGVVQVIPNKIAVQAQGYQVSVEGDISKVFQTISDAVMEYRQARNLAPMADIETAKPELADGIKALADILISQYAAQLNQLTHKGCETIAMQAAIPMVNLIIAGNLLTHSEGATISVQEQLLKAILKNISKVDLETKNPKDNKNWNTDRKSVV